MSQFFGGKACFEQDELVCAATGRIMTIWDEEDWHSSPPGPFHAPDKCLTAAAMRLLACEVERRQATWLCIVQLRIRVRRFCQLVVARLPACTEALVLKNCAPLAADEIALLSATLADRGVKLRELGLVVEDTQRAREAIASLCEAHCSIERLIVAGLDDSQIYSARPYALTAKLVCARRFITISLPHTPPPCRLLDADLACVARQCCTQFSFAGDTFADLSAYFQ
jgi:hypothetical protein